MSLENRIIRLEEMISLQQQELLGISKELYAQHQENQQLRELITHLRRQFKDVEREIGGGIRPIDEETPPPHY